MRPLLATKAGGQDGPPRCYRAGELTAVWTPAAVSPAARRDEGVDQAASEWIKTHVHLDQPALEATLEDYLYELEHVAVQKAPAEIKTAYRDAASVVTIVSELGWLSCFQGPRQLMGYSGLVAREHSNGNRIQRGSIAKIGNAHLRRVLVEAASAYQHRSNVTGYLLRRQKSLAARGKNKNQS